jgi:hypothetical protein
VSTTTPRLTEIRESPEASPAGALNITEDSPLFEPQDIDLEIPSQDLAFVQPSEPPSSCQNYATVGSSQRETAAEQLNGSLVLPDSQQTPRTGTTIVTEEPLVPATSQNAPSVSGALSPTRNSTDRVVPDSQSLPTSLNVVSQPGADDGEEAASQLVEDLQTAAEAVATTTRESNSGAGSQSSLPPSQTKRHEQQPSTTKSLSQNLRATSLRAPSPETPPSISRSAHGRLEKARERTDPSSPHTTARKSSSQIDYRQSIEDQTTQAAVQASHSDQQTESFPFETQIAQVRTQASTQTPAKFSILSHSQPTSESIHPSKALAISPRANSLPAHHDSLSSSFPAVPSQTLPTIGESAPSLPHIPSTLIRTSTISTANLESMDRRAPTSGPKMGMAAKIKAMKAEQAARRGRTPSKSRQATPVKPSAVPPRINAELAAETPAQAGSVEPTRNGGRSPSTVPAVLPVQKVTQEEMNTSGRYKTLVPQEKDNPSLRRQSTVTGTALKEASKGGNFVHSVPIALMGHQRDSYPSMIQEHNVLIRRFLDTNNPSEDLTLEIEALLERLRRIVVHPDLDNIESYTQYDVAPAVHAQWAIDSSAKFHFLKHLIDELRNRRLTITVVCQSGQLLQILENFLLGLNVTCYRADSNKTARQEDCELTVTIMFPNDDNSHACLTTDAVICLDNSAESSGYTSKLLQEPTRNLVLMSVVVPRTIEHVERCLSPNLTYHQKLRALVHGIYDLRHEAGKLEYGHLPSVETAKVIAAFISSSPADREWSIATLSMLENLDSQTESDVELPPSSSGVAQPGGKHKLEEVEMPASDSFKRPRLALNGAQHHDEPITINPLELDISHVSESMAVTSHPPLVSSGSIDPSGLGETVRRLQSLLLTAQTSLAEHRHDLGELQYRNEDQRNQLIELTRKNDEADDVAQKAVTRMTEGIATANALRTENRSLKEQLKAAQETLADHSIPERAELEQQRLALERSQEEIKILEKRLKTQQSDLDYAQEEYQNSSSAARELSITNRELKTSLRDAQSRASGEQARAKQMTLDARAQNLDRENKQLKAKLSEQTEALARKDKELSLLKEASRGRMGTRGSSVPRSPRMGSPLKNAAGSRQSSPSAGELRGKTHPLRQG